MRARTWCRTGAAGLATGAVLLVLVTPATAADGGHGFGRMGPATARTTSVSPSAGPDFELPFLCGQAWTGTTRSSHSPSSYTIDFNAPDDLNKPVLASAPGVVIKAVSLTNSYGRYVIVDHGSGYTTLYAHLNSIAAVVGQAVDQGDLIGYLGTSGNSTGPHLHFEQRRDGAYFRPYFHRATFGFGSTTASRNCTDRPVAGDWNGDGKAEFGIFRNNSNGGKYYLRTAAGNAAYTWGRTGDVPVIGDYDGDAVSQIGVRRYAAGSWALRGGTGAVATVNGVGAAYDTPLTGDWDGNGRANLGFYRPSSHRFYLRADDGSLTYVAYGLAGDRGVAGDWNGDGRTEVAVFRSGKWHLRAASGTTYVTRTFGWGVAGDLPVVGDWNGDNRSDVGVWRPRTGEFLLKVPTTGGAWERKVYAMGQVR